jgi:hypothetical protein
MRYCIWCLPLLLLVLGCSRPCCPVAARIPAPPCRAEGTDSEGWRIATSICRKLEQANAEFLLAKVDGTHLTLRVTPRLGEQLLSDEASLRQSMADFLSLMSEETDAIINSVDLFSEDVIIASGKSLESGKNQITISDSGQ